MRSAAEKPIQEHFAALVDDHDRTSLICDDIESALGTGRRCIVLSQWRRHCLAITKELIERGTDPILLHGELGKRERARLLDQLAQTSPDQNLVVVATSQLLGEGFDCPQLDTLFLAFPIAFKGRLVPSNRSDSRQPPKCSELTRNCLQHRRVQACRGFWATCRAGRPRDGDG